MAPTEEREHFSRRLRLALDSAGWKALGAAGLAREFNQRSRSHTVTPHATRKWLRGEAIPSQDKLRVLAAWLAVTPERLRFGEPPLHDKALGGARAAAAGGPERGAKLASDFARLDAEQQQLVEHLVRMLLRQASSS